MPVGVRQHVITLPLCLIIFKSTHLAVFPNCRVSNCVHDQLTCALDTAVLNGAGVNAGHDTGMIFVTKQALYGWRWLLLKLYKQSHLRFWLCNQVD